jgi:thioredoxin 1
MIVYINHLNDSNFKESIKEGLWIVDIHAPWCGPCRQLSPIIDEFSAENSDKIRVGKINADESPETMTELEIRSIPTILVYKDGEIVNRHVGMASKAKLGELVSDFIN